MISTKYIQLLGLCWICSYCISPIKAQTTQNATNVKQLVQTLFEKYDQYRENTLQNRRFKHTDIQPLLEKAKTKYGFEVRQIGQSIEKRPIHLVRLGSGKTSLFLWSQMHGNEPTATAAVFDIFNFFGQSDEFDSLKTKLLEQVSLYFIPMLNPDGAERFSRYNATGIDLNRDARRLSSPESQLLKHIRDSLNADWGFNLHDQGRHHATKKNNPATISFLAPPFDSRRSVNTTRKDAMQLIAELYRTLSAYIPDHIGRYYDGYNARAFGDNIQKWGTRTVLIESGAYPNDPERQFVRKINFVALIGAFISISQKNYKKYPVSVYKSIPHNRSTLKDVRLKKLTYQLLDTKITTDITINRLEIECNKNRDFYYQGSVQDVGELLMYHGHDDVDCSGLRAEFGKVFEKEYESLEEIKKLNFRSLLSKGYVAVRLRLKSVVPKNYVELPANQIEENQMDFSPFPCHILINDAKLPKWVNRDENPSFIIYRGDRIKYILLNGFLYDPHQENPEEYILNGLIYR